jgi:hypothetical protein
MVPQILRVFGEPPKIRRSRFWSDPNFVARDPLERRCKIRHLKHTSRLPPEVGRILKHIEYGVPPPPDFRKYT